MNTSIRPGLALALACSCSAEPGVHRGEERAAVVQASGERGEALAIGFDQAVAGTLPAGWRIGGTKQVGPLASWEVVADPTAPTAPNALALTSSTHGSGGTFNLCWTDAVSFESGTLELAFKANRGEEDQGGGPIWRVQDENDYYLCRMNPLESNFRLYCVKDGERKQLASAEVQAASGTWHRIRVEHAGPHIVCTVDGGARLEATDDSLPRKGGVGLWTKADAETSFDDLVLRSTDSAAPARALLVPAGAIELPGVEGRIDHLALDAKRERLFVAALGNDSVEVLDLKAGKVLRSLPASEPQGILYLADCDRMVVASGRSGTCDVHDGDTLERVATVAVGAHADNLRYDARTRRLYAAHDGALGIVDAASWKLVGEIPLAGHPESFQLDPEGKRAFVNVPDARQVAHVDLEARKVLATWPIEEAQANFPMAWAPGGASDPDGLLLLGCRSPASLLVRAASNGAPLGRLELAGDTDDIFYDARRRRAYVACGAGSIDVFEHDERAGFRPAARIPTAPGARTCLFVPEREQLFVAVPRREAQRAEVRIFTLGD